MHLPELTHLQFLVLDALGPKEKRGKEMRHDLEKAGVTKTGPAFYQMMARLEEAKFVEGRYATEIIAGQIIKERVYRILGTGVQALEETRSFYRAKLSGSNLAIV